MKTTNKPKLNFIIDIIMFVLMMAIAGVGFLIKYILIPGFKRNEIYGRNVELYYWGIDRHEWANIHLILSFTFLFLLLLHIVFHWKLMVGLYRKMIPNKMWRILLASTFVILSLLLSIMPLFVSPEITKGESHHIHSNAKEQSHSPQLENRNAPEIRVHRPEVPLSDLKHEKHTDIAINGKMTINEVAIRYNISASELCTCIGVPNTKVNEKLGRLKKTYAFDMDALRNFIECNTNQ